AGRRIPEDVGAVRVVQRRLVNAQFRQFGGRGRIYRIANPDVVPVEGDGQARHEARLQHHACGPGLRDLFLQIRISAELATARGVHLGNRTWAKIGDLIRCQTEPAEQCLTVGDTILRSLFAPGNVAWIVQAGESAARRPEQLADIGRTYRL